MRQSEDGGLRGQGGFNPPAETCRTNIDQREAALTGTELQQLNNNSKPHVEETVNIVANRLKERRRELGLPESIKVGIAFTTHTNIVIQAWSDSLGWEGESVCFSG